MGKTYKNYSQKWEEETSGRSGKPKKHTNGKKTGGMKTLNSYVEEEDDDYFDDDIEISDSISIQHTKNTP